MPNDDPTPTTDRTGHVCSTVELGALPEEHPLRNTPLADIQAEFRNLLGTKWSLVRPSYGIARATYNSLAQFWRDLNEWRAPNVPMSRGAETQPPERATAAAPRLDGRVKPL